METRNTSNQMEQCIFRAILPTGQNFRHEGRELLFTSKNCLGIVVNEKMHRWEMCINCLFVQSSCFASRQLALLDTQAACHAHDKNFANARKRMRTGCMGASVSETRHPDIESSVTVFWNLFPIPPWEQRRTQERRQALFRMYTHCVCVCVCLTGVWRMCKVTSTKNRRQQNTTRFKYPMGNLATIDEPGHKKASPV